MPLVNILNYVSWLEVHVSKIQVPKSVYTCLNTCSISIKGKGVMTLRQLLQIVAKLKIKAANFMVSPKRQ